MKKYIILYFKHNPKNRYKIYLYNYKLINSSNSVRNLRLKRSINTFYPGDRIIYDIDGETLSAFLSTKDLELIEKNKTPKNINLLLYGIDTIIQNRKIFTQIVRKEKIKNL